MGLVVVSLFDGIACGYEALKRAGIKVSEYHAFEIDKYAIQIAKKNHPDIIHHGSVVGADFSQFKGADLLIGGSPCHGFSFAGKQLAFDDPRSKLFFEFVRAKDEINPKKFLLENVKMKKEYLDTISSYLWVEPILINSSLVSAQNRKRYYWCNWGVEQPEDKGILLKDIVHETCDIGTPQSEGWIKWFKKNNKNQIKKKYSSLNPEKAITMTARQYASWNGNFWLETLCEYIVPFDKTLQILDKEVKRGKIGYFGTDSQSRRVYDIHNKSVTLCGSGGGGGAKMGQYLFGGIYQIPRGKNKGGFLKNDTKSPTITSNSFEQNNLLFGCITPDRVNKRQNGQRFNDGRKFYTLTAQDKHGVLIEGYIRKLTPIECERLQTLNDGYSELGIDTRYQTFNNGNVCNLRGSICDSPAPLKNVINPSQVGKLNFAISTILEKLDMEQQTLPENLLIKVKNVKYQNVRTKNKQLEVIASSTIKLGNENNLLTKVKNVRFAINLSDLGTVECALSTMHSSNEMEILYTMSQENSNHTETGKNTIKMKMVNGLIDELLNKKLVENSKKEKLFTTLTLINLIIVKAILSSSQIQPTCLYIDSWNQLQENLLEMTLLSMRMENIQEMSNSARYKMLGNGWTCDVIKHIFESM